MHTFYILYSPHLKRYYIGQTSDLSHRLNQHNDKVNNKSWTKKGIPWEIYLVIDCKSRSQSMKLEFFVKKMKSKLFIERKD